MIFKKVDYFYKLAQTDFSGSGLEKGVEGKMKPDAGYPSESIRSLCEDSLTRLKSFKGVPEGVKSGLNGLGDYLEDFVEKRFGDSDLNKLWDSYLSALMKKIDLVGKDSGSIELYNFYSSLFKGFSDLWNKTAGTEGWQSKVMKPAMSSWVGLGDPKLDVNWKGISDQQHKYEEKSGLDGLNPELNVNWDEMNAQQQAYEKNQKISSVFSMFINKYSKLNKFEKKLQKWAEDYGGQIGTAIIYYQQNVAKLSGVSRAEAEDEFDTIYPSGVTGTVRKKLGVKKPTHTYDKTTEMDFSSEPADVITAKKPTHTYDKTTEMDFSSEPADVITAKKPTDVIKNIPSGYSAADNIKVQRNLLAFNIKYPGALGKDLNPSFGGPSGTGKYTDSSGKEHNDIDGIWGNRSKDMLEDYANFVGGRTIDQARKELAGDVADMGDMSRNLPGKTSGKMFSMIKKLTSR